VEPVEPVEPVEVPPEFPEFDVDPPVLVPVPDVVGVREAVTAAPI